jgi:8-oxo-dGTP pyrophosphatase MutT (NUDIX family)
MESAGRDPYTRIAQREIYRNPWLSVEVHDIVHPTGTASEHLLVVSPAASAVLVVDGDSFVFARQARFGARSRVIEIVKGGADADESPILCAQRELREELGLEADAWSSLGIVHEIPSIVVPPVSLFVAAGIRHTAADQEAVEQIERFRMPVDEAYRAALDGRIDDAVTLAALLRYRLITCAAEK